MAKQTLITHTARCDTCGAECFAANARDWAHDHANRNKGHAVGLELGYYIESLAPKRKPCKECPFKRDSVKGYLGQAESPDQFIGPHWHGTEHLPCHMLVDWESASDSDTLASTMTCEGFAIMCSNSLKLPRNKQDSDYVKTRAPDHKNIFSHVGEFLDHHKKASNENQN